MYDCTLYKALDARCVSYVHTAKNFLLTRLTDTCCWVALQHCVCVWQWLWFRPSKTRFRIGQRSYPQHDAVWCSCGHISGPNVNKPGPLTTCETSTFGMCLPNVACDALNKITVAMLWCTELTMSMSGHHTVWCPLVGEINSSNSHILLFHVWTVLKRTKKCLWGIWLPCQRYIHSLTVCRWKSGPCWYESVAPKRKLCSQNTN